MNSQQLEYFVLLAETEHMTQAAKQLNTSQPNLSYAMKELEKEIGVTLFKKEGRNIRLTKYGKIFYPYAQQSIHVLNQAQRKISDLTDSYRGYINFGFIYTMGTRIAPLITHDFLSIEKNKQIQFKFEQGNSKHIVEQLIKEEIDLAFSSYVSHQDEIQFEPFLKEDIVLVVSENHPLAQQDSVYLKDVFSDDPLVYFDHRSGLRPYLDDLFSQLQLKPDIAIEVEEDHTILGFVSYQFGIAVMPNIPSISAYPVKALKILDQHDPRWIYLAIRKNDPLPPAAERFYHFCMDNRHLYQ